MIDKNFIKRQIDNLAEEKKYDNRAKPMLLAYFTVLSDRYDYTEDQLIDMINRYKSKIEQISFYNIGADNYMYEYGKGLVLDRELVEGLDETNAERALRTVIRANSTVIFGNAQQSYQNIVEMSAQASLYEYAEDIYANINDMIAITFGRMPEELLMIHEYLDKFYTTKDQNEYAYFSDSKIILSTIDSKVKDILDGNNVKEAYKAIYTACLLNLKIKTVDFGLVDDNSASQYTRIIEKFEQYREILGIQESELDSVSLDNSNSSWTKNCNNILQKLQEKFQTTAKIDRDNEKSPRKVVFDRKQLIEWQVDENSKIDNSITEEEIRQKVDDLIEQKNYPREFQVVLHEFFTRSAEEFEWDRETVEKKIENLGRNVNSFEYKQMENDDIVARFNAMEKRIEIGDSPFSIFISNSELAETIMHELKHATDITERTEVGRVENSFIQLDTNDINQVNALNELITEGSTVQIFGKRAYKDSLATTYNLNGYEELSFATTMISSALGMTESEFFKLANKGENKFKEALETRYPGLDLSTKVDEIQEALTSMYIGPALYTRKTEAKGYAMLYNTLSDVYEARTAMDKQEGKFDPVRARYDEYRLNKNMILAQKRLHLPKRAITERIPNYGEIARKATVDSGEKKGFKQIAKEISAQIKLRDNRALARSGRGIRRYKRYFKDKLKETRKAIAAPKEALIQPRGPMKSFEERREEFLQETHGDVDIAAAQKKVNSEERDKQAQREEGEVPGAEDPRQ